MSFFLKESFVVAKYLRMLSCAKKGHMFFFSFLILYKTTQFVTTIDTYIISWKYFFTIFVRDYLELGADGDKGNIYDFCGLILYIYSVSLVLYENVWFKH